MIPYIFDDSVVYTDTDSIFTTKPLPSHLIGNGLGEMKDELSGLIIEEGIFIDIKIYGYWFYDEDSKRVERSVISGVERNTVSFEELKEVFNGKTITRTVESRFFKDLKILSIKINSTQVTIKNTNPKKIVNNEYLPIIINKIDDNFSSLSIKKA